MTVQRSSTFFVFASLWILLLFDSHPALAHPMDMASMRIQVEGSRLKVSLRLHVLAAARFTNQQQPPKNDSDVRSLEEPLFRATLRLSAPRLGGDLCQWRQPSLVLAEPERQFLDLSVIAVCTLAKPDPFSLEFPLPFLQNAPSVFELVARIEGAGELLTALASPAKPQIEVGTKKNTSFGGFLKLGMGHIGALPEEWHSFEGGARLPEGLDHIFFVLALVLSGGTLVGLLSNVTGFTIGHSLTLGLSTFKIIHVHSRWVEAFIALSIAYVAGISLFRPRSPHRWLVAALFGTVHGLGFASVLQELELSRQEIIPSLFGFNLGVELGQLTIIALTLPLLLLLKRNSDRSYLWTHRLLSVSLLLIGSYWFLQRAIA